MIGDYLYNIGSPPSEKICESIATALPGPSKPRPCLGASFPPKTRRTPVLVRRRTYLRHSIRAVLDPYTPLGSGPTSKTKDEGWHRHPQNLITPVPPSRFGGGTGAPKDQRCLGYHPRPFEQTGYFMEQCNSSHDLRTKQVRLDLDPPRTSECMVN